jgi:hypothetical protein
VTWFAFKGYYNNQPIDVAGSQEKEVVALGFHGYGTAAQAAKNPNSVNVFNGWIVDAAVEDYEAALKEQAQPGGANASNPVGAVTSDAESTIPGLGQISSFFSDISQAATWERVGEVLVGVIILYVALKGLTGADPVAAVKNTVKSKGGNLL